MFACRCANCASDVGSRCANAACDGSNKLLADGIFDTASTPARSRAFSPIAPPRISNFLVLLGESPRPPWRRPRDPRNRSERSSLSAGRPCLHTAFPRGRFWRACSWQHARSCSRFTSTGAQVLHLGNCQTGVVGNHNDARAFEDLAEFLDHFLFLGSIHSSLQVWDAHAPRLIFAGVEVRNRNSPGVQVFPVSGRRLSPGLRVTHRLGRNKTKRTTNRTPAGPT